MNSPRVSSPIGPGQPRTLRDYARAATSVASRQSRRSSSSPRIPRAVATRSGGVHRPGRSCPLQLEASIERRGPGPCLPQGGGPPQGVRAAGNIFFDLAEHTASSRGGKRVASEGQHRVRGWRVLLALTTNRLHRKLHRALQFVEEELVERGRRSDLRRIRDRYRRRRASALANEFSRDDGRVRHLRSMPATSAQAHEGLFERGLVCGTITFGYRGEPIPGEFTEQKGPRRRLVATRRPAPRVLQIFRWFVEDRVTIAGIVRRLNGDSRVQLPPRCMSGRWSRRAVRLLLSNSQIQRALAVRQDRSRLAKQERLAGQRLHERPLRDEQIEGIRHTCPIRSGTLPKCGSRNRPRRLPFSGRSDGPRRTHPPLLQWLVLLPVARPSPSRPGVLMGIT